VGLEGQSLVNLLANWLRFPKAAGNFADLINFGFGEEPTPGNFGFGLRKIAAIKSVTNFPPREADLVRDLTGSEEF